jgi:signal peptidase I
MLRDGCHFSTVYVGNSMYPTFKGPDLLYVRYCGVSQVATGDIIVFCKPGSDRRVVHRVIARRAGKVRTRGDNNFNHDPYTLADGDILGKVVYYQRGRKLVKVRSGLPGLVIAIARRLLWRATSVSRWGLAGIRRRIARITGRR